MKNSPARLLISAAPALFVVMWATGFVVARLSAPHADPLSFLSFRFAIAGLLFAVKLDKARLLEAAGWKPTGPDTARPADTEANIRASAAASKSLPVGSRPMSRKCRHPASCARGTRWWRCVRSIRSALGSSTATPPTVPIQTRPSPSTAAGHDDVENSRVASADSRRLFAT